MFERVALIGIGLIGSSLSHVMALEAATIWTPLKPLKIATLLSSVRLLGFAEKLQKQSKAV